MKLIRLLILLPFFAGCSDEPISPLHLIEDKSWKADYWTNDCRYFIISSDNSGIYIDENCGEHKLTWREVNYTVVDSNGNPMTIEDGKYLLTTIELYEDEQLFKILSLSAVNKNQWIASSIVFVPYWL